jgi:hypothetical protein
MNWFGADKGRRWPRDAKSRTTGLTHFASRFPVWTVGMMVFGLAGALLLRAADGAADAETQARIEKYDKGPATINVSDYPQKLQDYYEVFSQKCSQCHRLSRPINSDYVLPEQWSRYIKRMMYKPGSNISASDAKKIYDFLVYDSSVRKKKQLDAKLKTLTASERAAQEQKINGVVQKYK